MRVLKVLNNSVIFALDDFGNEVVLMGKGIGFNKSLGYELKKKEIEKVFIIKDRDNSKNIIRLASEIDSTFFELTKTLVDFAVEEFKMELMEHIYLSLTDHLSFAVKRLRSGVIIENFYISEMKKFNPNEYRIGLYALEMMKKELDLDFPIDEAGNIAFHFINAQYGNSKHGNNRLIISTVKEIINIVKYYFELQYNEESLAYSRFVTHLKHFADNLINKKNMESNKDDNLYNEVILNCKKEYDCVKKIAKYVKSNFNVSLTILEELYLTIHIHRIINEGII